MYVSALPDKEKELLQCTQARKKGTKKPKTHTRSTQLHVCLVRGSTTFFVIFVVYSSTVLSTGKSTWNPELYSSFTYGCPPSPPHVCIPSTMRYEIEIRLPYLYKFNTKNKTTRSTTHLKCFFLLPAVFAAADNYLSDTYPVNKATNPRESQSSFFFFPCLPSVYV